MVEGMVLLGSIIGGKLHAKFSKFGIAYGSGG